jgi:hypothetical protein
MSTEKTYFFDKSDNIKLVLRLFYGCCLILFVLDFFIHRHVYHTWENLWGFYPLYGFVGCVVLVLIAKWMRTFLMREDNYYQRRADQLKQQIGDEKGEGDHAEH